MQPKEDNTGAELREWLGATPADLMVYGSIAATAAMFFISNPFLDALLAVVGIALAVIACPLGMKRNPKLSEFTNIIKLVSYIPGAILVIAAVAVHYLYFNR